MGARLAAFLLVVIALSLAACGGSWVNGPLLSPPAISDEAAIAISEHAPAPPDEWPVMRPVAVRVYPTGELIVDVLVVVRATEPSWANNPGSPVPVSDSLSTAAFYTNGLNVPAVLHSSGVAGPPILLHGAASGSIAATRAVLGHAPFQENFPRLQASDSYLGNIRAIDISRAGMQYRACFVPVLLSTDRPVRSGEAIDVRIGGKDDRVDPCWYRLRAVLFDPNDSASPAR